VDSLPLPPGVIAGPQFVQWNQQGVVFSVSPVANATGYLWNVPSSVTITSGAGNPSITVNFPWVFSSGLFTVAAITGCGMGSFSPALQVFGLSPIPITINVQSGNVTAGQEICYNASQTILVAGSGSFTVQSGGSVTMISGRRILFQKGTRVYSGGYLHGMITLTGQYCSSLKEGIPVNPDVDEVKEPGEALSSGGFILYPNPTQGVIHIPLPAAKAAGNESSSSPEKAFVFNSMGQEIRKIIPEKGSSIDINLADFPPGIYVVVLQSGNETKVWKVVKL
jgi:hypothetical protein